MPGLSLPSIVITLMLLITLTTASSVATKQNETRIASDEQRLFRKLMRNYEKSVRPVINSTMPVVVSLGITLTQILDIDERNQVLTVNVWLDQGWVDQKLKWDPKDFGGLEILRIPCDFLWLPDILLYNSVDDYTTGYMRSLAMVSNDGSVFWPPIVRFRSSCKVDITYFPFDDQVCHMKLGSWAYDGFQVDVVNNSGTVDLSNYIDNGEWELISASSIRNVIYYTCCPQPFPDVTFWFHLRRRTTYYTFNVIVPCLMLSILTLASFILPAESGEKVSLGLTVLLAFSVFMLLIAENMPATSEFVPLIGVYLTVIMAMTSMSVVFSVFILHLHHKGGRRVRAPRWLRWVALHILARILWVRTQRLLRWNERLEDYGVKIKPGFGSFNEGFRLQSMKNLYKVENGQLHRCYSNKPQNNEQNNQNKGRQAEAEIVKYLRLVLERQEIQDLENVLVTEWEEISIVFDRLLFVLFSSTALLATLALLVFKPLYKDVTIQIPS